MVFRHLYKPDKSEYIGEEIINDLLIEMEQDSLLNTKPVLVKDDENSVRLVSFREKHLSYLKTHPNINPQNYLANIKTMIRIRA